jgi:Flp pilus assembly protein TadD
MASNFGIRPSPLGLLATAIALFFFGTLGGCTSLATPRPVADGATAGADSSGAVARPVVPAGADALPDVDLSSELLFRLVYAEIALQRGEPGPAFLELMRVASQTHDPRVARRATEVAMAARALPQALEAAELWHSLAPSDQEAEQSYSSLLVANGHHEQARPLLERQIAQSANPIETLDRLQRVLAHSPEPAQGYAVLEQVAQRYVQDPATAFDAHLIVARGARVAGNNAAAVVHARAALALRPDSEAAAIAVAQLLVEGDRSAAPGGTAVEKAGGPVAAHTEAAAILAQFLQAHPDAIDARLVYARVLVGADRLEEAQRQFEDVLRRAPKNADSLFALGVLALEAERFAEARNYLERYIAALGTSSGHDLDLVYMNMSRVAEGERRFDEALDWLHKVHGPDQAAGARQREAFILGRLNRADEGMKLLQQLPGDTVEERTQRVLLQGQLLRDAHRYQESYNLLDEALRGSPNDSGLLYETAMSAERLDRIDVMETRLRRLLELHPDYAHAYNALGYSLADRNIRLQEAYQLIDHALTLSPDDGFIVDSMGWVQYRLGNLEAARASLTRAFRLKADPDVAAHLGEVLWATGDRSGARTLLLDAQKRDGDSDTLRETLQRLNIQP